MPSPRHAAAGLAGLLAAMIAAIGPAITPAAARTDGGEGPEPAHHGEGTFQNPHLEPTDRGLTDFLRMRFFGDETWPDAASAAGSAPTVQVNLEKIHNPDPDVMQVTWIGHATMLVQYAGVNILTDPIFSDRASPFSFAGPKRYTPPALRPDQLPRIDAAVISHNHYDHLDLASIAALSRAGDGGPRWHVPLGNGALVRDGGAAKVSELDWWQAETLPGGVTITLTPSQHWSARTPFDRDRSLWGAWLITFPDGRKVWFGGDTGYNDIQFREIGARAGPIDLALIPIGAYAPRWFMKRHHVNPEEAVLIHKDIGSAFSVGMHWGSFVLTSEPVTEPPERLRAAARGLPPGSFVTLKVGETRAAPPRR